ncbi:MAG: D-cysteine desulfhydrase family protein [Desulfatiglandales bacterium]|jgi:D-cysteine desulfhydrase|nr:D-cysteine desulfhydrase family protein [Desulfatiglandales bacterium]
MEKKLRDLEERLKSFPRLSLSLVPTPCHRMDFLSEEFGVDLYCKRDDLTGFGFGGNKSRKLEFLIGEARERGCDTLVTTGGIQSNFCRLTAAAGAVVEMSVHLILGGGRPAEATGNVLLDEMLGAHIHYVTSPDWNYWEEESEKVARKLEKLGRKVFRIPIGGSVPVGAVGYAAAFVEILKDQARMNTSFDHIIHACSSGGTTAGLVVGKELTGWPGRISGICVAMDKKNLEKTVLALAGETAALLGGEVTPQSILVNDDFIGDGYAIRTTLAEKAIELFARREGIFLDHVYTGKAAGALLEWLEKGRLSGQKVLFLHTGGQVELFARAGK